MADYISREVAIAKLTALEIEKQGATMADARRALANMPVADVIEVVRCGACEREARSLMEKIERLEKYFGTASTR